MIKVILFDIGGVYCKGQAMDFLGKGAKYLGLDPVKFVRGEQPCINIEWNKGKLSLKEMFESVFNIGLNDEQVDDLRKMYVSNWTVDNKIVEFVMELKKNYVVAVLSNSDPVVSGNLEKNGYYKLFDFLVLSHRLGFVKPDDEIYKYSIVKSKVNADEILFIDDQEVNISAAQRNGMKGVVFKDEEQLKVELRNFDIKLD